LDKTEQMLHRLIVGNVPNGYEVDHTDNNPLNNTRANWRIVTKQQNLLNRTLPNSTGFIGAACNGKGNSFRAQVKVNGRVHSAGSFATAKEAGIVRDEIMDVIGQGYCKFNFAPKDRSISDAHMRQTLAAAAW